MKNEPAMESEASFLKALSEPTRLRLAVLLAIHGETCVCQLAEAMKAPEYKISRHLGIMRSAGIVRARREGTWMHYQLAKARNSLEACLQQCFKDCLCSHQRVKKDLKRLSKDDCKNI